jgi:mannitol 2-dehydrogenase
MIPIKLSLASLQAVSGRAAIPAYDPAQVRPGIVHLGLGGFHRAHMARYTHELMNRDAENLGWGIIGAGLLPSDARLIEALKPQDWLYTLVERDARTERAQIVGSLAGIVSGVDDPDGLIAAIASPPTRIVSLTVTANGYGLNQGTRRLDLDHPAVVADLANPRRPQTVVGVIAEGYRRRMVAGLHRHELRQHPEQRPCARTRHAGLCRGH